jgi:signal peptidase
MNVRRTRLLVDFLRVGAFWFGGSLVLCLLLAAAIPSAIGGRSYVMRSASMAPTIEPGDVVVTRPIQPLEARVGEIVTFDDPSGSGHLLSHRVRSIERAGDRVRFVTQGDANSGEEHWTVAIDGRIGRVLYRIPKLGYALAWIQGPLGHIGVLVVPAVLLTAVTLARIWNPRPPNWRRDVGTN